MRLIHDEIGPLLMDFETQTFQRIPDTRNKFFMKGRMFDYSEDLTDVSKECIVPVWCEKTGEKGKRTFCVLLSGEVKYTFWNVERPVNYWEKNIIENIFPNKAYFIYVDPVAGSDNGVLIRSAKMIGS